MIPIANSEPLFLHEVTPDPTFLAYRRRDDGLEVTAEGKGVAIRVSWPGCEIYYNRADFWSRYIHRDLYGSPEP
jgi:hypothetical protein